MLKNTLFYFMLLFLSLNVAANDYYQIQIDVPDQSASSRNQVLNQAFVDVLVKVAGTQKILQSQPLQQISKTDIKASLLSYAYQKQGTVLQLQCRFNPDVIKQALAQLKQSAWTDNRPHVLAWLYLDPQGIISELTPDAQQALMQQASKRGLELLLPLLDIEDMQAISPAQVQKADHTALLTASKRYRPNVIVNADIHKAGAQFQGSWHIYIGSENITWQKTYPSLKKLLTDSINIISDTLFNRYKGSSHQSSPQSQQSPVKLRVYGVKDLNDYAQLQNFLTSQDEIGQINIEQASADKLYLELNVSGGKTGLMQILRAGGLQALSIADDGQLHYQWQR